MKAIQLFLFACIVPVFVYSQAVYEIKSNWYTAAFTKYGGNNNSRLRVIWKDGARSYLVEQYIVVSITAAKIQIDGSDPRYIKGAGKEKGYDADHFTLVSDDNENYTGHNLDDAGKLYTVTLRKVKEEDKRAVLQKYGW